MKIIESLKVRLIKILSDPDLPQDIHAYLGTALLAWGSYYIYPPAALIVPGAIFLYIAFRR